MNTKTLAALRDSAIENGLGELAHLVTRYEAMRAFRIVFGYAADGGAALSGGEEQIADSDSGNDTVKVRRSNGLYHVEVFRRLPAPSPLCGGSAASLDEAAADAAARMANCH